MTTLLRQRASRPGLTVRVSPGVRGAIRRLIVLHADRDVAGVLIGRAVSADVRITAVIPSFGAADPGSPIVLTSDTWTAIQRECGRYPEQSIVGWYRSRHDGVRTPGHDDVRIHRRYFDSPAQLMLTVSASDGSEAWFMWRDQQFSALDRHDIAHVSSRRFGLWPQRIGCALIGVTIGAAGWFSFERSDVASPARARRPAATAPAIAHRIVIEPQAGVQTGFPNP